MVLITKIMKTQAITFPIAAALIFLSPTVLAEPAKPVAEKKAPVMKVEVAAHPVLNIKAPAPPKGADKDAKKTVELEFVTYNHDRSQFVGYYQDGWFEMVSLHDAKTKKQLAYVYCEGGVPKTFRFSKNGKHLGAEANVGWYVWEIPTFEELLILGDTDFYSLNKELGVVEGKNATE